MTTNLNNVNLRDDTFLISKIQAHVFNQGANYTPLSNQFRISSVGYCMRKLQFDKIIPEHKQPFDMKTQGTFAVGNAVHEYIQEHLPDDILIKDEFQVNYTYNNIKLIGHIDLLIQTPDGIKLVDIKTSNPRSF